MSKTGVVYLKVKCYLELDLDENDVQDMVENLDYEIQHKDIQSTEIVEHSTNYSMP